MELNALSRIAPSMDFNKKCLLVNAFFMSQFNYCHLIWMCHNRTKNNKINRIQERCLRLIFNDKKSSFENLLDKDKSVSVHHQNLRRLSIEKYKVHCGISPEILINLFPLKQADQYNLRNRSQFVIPNLKTVNYGFESLRYLGPKIWKTNQSHFKEIVSLKNVKNPIKKVKPESCPCRLCKIYVQNTRCIYAFLLILYDRYITLL